MNIFNSITVTDITHVFNPIFDEPIVEKMTDRPFFGLSFAIDGEIIYRHNGKEYISDHNHAVLLPQGASYILNCHKPGQFTLVNFHCTPDFEFNEFLSIPISDIASDKFIRDHQALVKLDLFKNPYAHAEFMSIFYNMISRLQRETMRNSTFHILRPAINCIMSKLTDPALSSEQLAESTGLSEVYFRKLFKSAYGVTPKQFLQQARIDKAKNLLESGNISITNIATNCGYSSINHFSRTFKEKTDYTPNEYREKFRKIFI